jgi:hypothetical protein
MNLREKIFQVNIIHFVTFLRRLGLLAELKNNCMYFQFDIFTTLCEIIITNRNYIFIRRMSKQPVDFFMKEFIMYALPSGPLQPPRDV